MFKHLSRILNAACRACGITTEKAAPPAGINKGFVEADDAALAGFVERFEGDSREVSLARDAIFEALDIKPGMAIGDVGAGTGLYAPLFHNAVGVDGAVYATELSPKMVEYLQQRVVNEKLSTVKVIQSTADTAGLPDHSCDLVFVGDAYHHFEYPGELLTGIKKGLKPGGRLAILDFHRIKGQSADWVMDHVRCGKQTVIKEARQSGFELLGAPDVDGLEENYLLIFKNT
jgi:SAM-dependent methyltransferase